MLVETCQHQRELFLVYNADRSSGCCQVVRFEPLNTYLLNNILENKVRIASVAISIINGYFRSLIINTIVRIVLYIV